MRTIPRIAWLIAMLILSAAGLHAAEMGLWDRLEIDFGSDRDYENPIYDVEFFGAVFRSPSGRQVEIRGFWDGDRRWKRRFQPDEDAPERFVSLLRDQAFSVILIYSPRAEKIRIYNPGDRSCRVERFDPVGGSFVASSETLEGRILEVSWSGPEDQVLILRRSN